MLPSSDRGIYILQIDWRICSFNQLTRQQRASLIEDQLLQVLSFMANFPSVLESSLAHPRGWRQPVKEDNSSSDHSEAGPSGAEQDTGSEVCNTPTGPTRQAQLARGGRVKARAQRGRARGRRAQEEGNDPVHRGEDHARPFSQFEVDRHPSKMTTWELDVIRQLYYVPDYMELRLSKSSDQRTQPPPGCIVVYRDYFIKGLRLFLHPFFREALLNLDVSLPQLNLNAVQSLVALWVLYRINHFLYLTVEEF